MLQLTKVVAVGLISAASVVAAGPASAKSSLAAECAAGGGVFSRLGSERTCTTTAVVEDATDVSQHSVLEPTSSATAHKYISTFVHHATTTSTTVSVRKGRTSLTTSSSAVTGRRNAQERCVRLVFTISAEATVPQAVEAVDLVECSSRGLFTWPLPGEF